MNVTPGKRLGFFTRLLDDVSAGERYRLALEQIRHAEALGFHAVWVAQHHFDAAEGGLPAPLVFFASVAAQTKRIRLGTGIIALALENPLRVAEDAAVLDLLSGGRLELGFGTGGSPANFAAFGLSSEERRAIYSAHVETLRDAWAGRALQENQRLYPAAPQLNDRVWQATFSPEGGRRAGQAGDGLLLSRTQPRPEGQPDLSLAAIQLPIIEAYLEALPRGRAPRILASRSVFVADDPVQARRFAEAGLRRFARRVSSPGRDPQGAPLDDLIRAFDTHVGTAAAVADSLGADEVLRHVTDVTVQVHPVDPPHPYTLRSLELFSQQVAPALGWQPTKEVTR